MRKITFIDHYDSFSFNLIDWLALHAPGVAIDYCAFDDSEKMGFLQKKPTALVFSPGPKSPADAALSCELLRASMGKVPILGVCLGFQMLGLMAGGVIQRSSAPRHGLARDVTVTDHVGLFQNAPRQFSVAAYNSLTLAFPQIARDFVISAVCENGEPQAIEYRPQAAFPAFGVQFHPESFLNGDMSFIVRALLQALAFR